MHAPGQVRGDGYSETLSILNGPKLLSQQVNRFGFILSMCNTHDLAFIRITYIHTLFVM